MSEASGVRLWEEDVWKQIISASALSDKPPRGRLRVPAKCSRPAHSRYGSTRPAVYSIGSSATQRWPALRRTE